MNDPERGTAAEELDRLITLSAALQSSGSPERSRGHLPPPQRRDRGGTGEAQLRDEGNYMGHAVIRTARLRAIGHGGQILCSGSTADVAGDALPSGVTLADLGAHRLKDLGRAEHVFGVCHPSLRREFPPLRSLDAIPNNLPVYLTSFIGRESELADLARLTEQYRLVTLTGSGGVGKTRLAARLAAETAGRHPDGAWWVELAPLADPDLVTETVLGVLHVPDAPGTAALQRLTAYLTARHLVLVLDNCEHVVESAATVAEAVLRNCPHVTVLVTSREGLGVGGEISWQVPPLAMPDKDAPAGVESLRSYDAVRLFVERSVRARTNFAVTNESAPVVAEICARLDGIPLAIELAAARVRVLTPQQILDGLQDRFRLLTGGGRVLPRQQTLEASVAWSYDLLNPEEQVLFRRLAVFAGGFTLDAAEFVTSVLGCEPVAVLDLLDGLVTKSLVVMEDTAGGAAARYRLLETMRAFAALTLSRAEETARARDAHLKFCLDSAEQADQAMVGVTPEHIRRYAAERDNYRVALDWALTSDDPVPALELAARQGVLLILLGRYTEAQEALQRALARPGAPAGHRSAAHWTLGCHQWFLGNVDGIRVSAELALQTAVEAGDPVLEGRAHHLAMHAHQFTDTAAAKSSAEIAVPMLSEAGDSLALMDLACHRSWIAIRADELDEARDWIERTHALHTATGSHWYEGLAFALEALISVRSGALAAARVAAQRAIGPATGIGEPVSVGRGRHPRRVG